MTAAGWQTAPAGQVGDTRSRRHPLCQGAPGVHGALPGDGRGAESFMFGQGYSESRDRGHYTGGVLQAPRSKR